MVEFYRPAMTGDTANDVQFMVSNEPKTFRLFGCTELQPRLVKATAIKLGSCMRQQSCILLGSVNVHERNMWKKMMSCYVLNLARVLQRADIAVPAQQINRYPVDKMYSNHHILSAHWIELSAL